MSRLLPLFLIFALPVTAPADDLKDILDRDAIAVQRLVSEVNDALAKAKAFEKNDLTRAKQVLEDALTRITNSKEMADDQRAVLRGRLQTRLTAVTRLARARELAEEEAAAKAAEKLKREQQANPPDGTGTNDTAKKRIASTRDQIAAAERLRDQKAKGNLGVFASIEVSATPIDGVVEYPKYWAQLTESRKNLAGNRLTEKEITLLKALNSTMSVDFDKTAFKDVIGYLSEKTGLAIFVDENSLKDAMVEYSDPVTFKVKKVTVRTILKKILADRGLSYILKEGTVQVVTTQRARETMVTRSYPIDDLVGLSNQLYGPFVNRSIMLSNVQTLIQNIQNAIDPSLWNINGGPGSITFSEGGRALIIRAPAEMHYMFGGGGLFGR
ncbi:MAG TPA: hypothetical protein VNX28_07370 [Gemmataceae bacterium]|jgi:hypothetical protein|nr:hypothetical protein [Gemmataceae bacterium]